MSYEPVQLGLPPKEPSKPPLHPLLTSEILLNSRPGFKKHPSYKWFALAFLFTLLMTVLGFISVFVPWAWKDIAVGVRVYAYPFKSCFENTFSSVNEERCIDNDFIDPEKEAAPLTGVQGKFKSRECEAYILATIAFVFISVIPGVFTLLLMIFCILMLWRYPIKSAAVILPTLIFLFCATVVAWAMFITYAEMECAPNSIFPVHGYSYGFIIYCFCSFTSLISLICWIIGLKKLLRFGRGELKLKKGQVIADAEPFAYPMYPQAPRAMSPYLPAPPVTPQPYFPYH